MKTDILIVGGGLSGLALAYQLEQAGKDYIVIESRARLGGRIHAHIHDQDQSKQYYDLGPSWFWDGQHRMAKLIDDLNLSTFMQYAQGELCYEDEQGNVQKGQGYASMAGSYRIKGGIIQLIDSIREKLPTSKCLSDHTALSFEQNETGITTTIKDKHQHTISIHSEKVVLALPPRVAAETLSYNPALSAKTIKAMQAIPTWMAGHAKVIATYAKPFWRTANLSGDAMSRLGPMVEIHDASPQEGGPYALFGFVGVPPHIRQQHPDELLKATRAQLTRLFGEEANHPIDVVLQDWAFEKETATDLDHQPLNHHPRYGLTAPLQNLWDGRLLLGSTETASDFGGYLEGALEAAEQVLAKL